MSFHFARMKDGRLTSFLTGQMTDGFATLEEAKAKSPDVLKGLRIRDKLVLVEVVQEVKVTCTVDWQKWPEATRKKHGV